MRYLFSILLMLCASFGFAQTISNVDFSVDGNNIVVTYDLRDCKSCDIGLFVSTDGGLTFSKNSLSPVSGDVGVNVTAGNKRMTWSPLISYPNGIRGDLIFEVRSMGNLKSNRKSNKRFTVNGVSFNMIYVKGGTFTMGATGNQVNEAESDEWPTHTVTLSDYYIGSTEVTQKLWQAVMGYNPSLNNQGGNYPVESVSWIDVQVFISRLNDLTGQNFVLPTEAQWEYAARGGRQTRHFKYIGSNYIDDIGWWKGNSGNRAHRVATVLPNELGIYDMSGNVREWCSDWFSNYDSYSQTDPKGPYYGEARVNRGGSYGSAPRYCRAANRDFHDADFRSEYLGLRLTLNE